MTDLNIGDEEFQKMVMCEGGDIMTTSLKVSKYFKKRHDNVVRAIRQLKKDCPPDFWLLNFEERDSVDARGKARCVFEMTKDGFVMLVMAFTGVSATAMKIKYINAFNWMAGELRNRALSFESRRNHLMLEYQQEKGMARFAGRALRRWQIKKPGLEGKIIALQHDGQHTLQLS